MDREITWLDCVKACDELIETIKLKMIEEPMSGQFWQEELAVAMVKRQEFLILAKQQEDQQFTQALEKICDNVLQKSKEQRSEI
jgi:hypothetical protein